MLPCWDGHEEGLRRKWAVSLEMPGERGGAETLGREPVETDCEVGGRREGEVRILWGGVSLLANRGKIVT